MKKNASYLFVIIMFKIILELSYYHFVNRHFSYMGFNYDFSLVKYMESLLMILWLFVIIPKNNNVSSIAVNILYILMVIPILSIYPLKNESRIYFYSVVTSFSILILTVKTLPRFKLKIKYNFNGLLKLVFIAMTSLVYFLLIRFNGLPNLKLLDFNEVYKIRSEIEYGYGFMQYLVTWQGAILNVFVMIVTLVSRRKYSFIFVSILQIMLYLLTTHKTFLFYPFVLYILILVLNRSKLHVGYIAAVGSSFGVLLSLGINKIFGNLMIPSMVISRIFFLPAQISYQYYEFFSQNGFVYLSHSVFRILFQTPVYSDHPIRLIGQAYYTNNWPNTGYLGDAYMNFGVIGMIIFSIIFGIVLKVIESLANTPFKLSITKAFIIIFMFSTSNIGLLTSMLNGGLVLFMVILYLFNDKSIDKKFFNRITMRKYNNLEKEGEI